MTANRIIREIERINRKIDQLRLLSRKFSWARLSIAAIAAISALSALYYKSGQLSWLAFFLFLIAFILLAFFHHRIKRKIFLFHIFSAIKQEHLHRKNLNWEKLPSEAANVSKNHPFAKDLNISGEFSLFRLLNSTVSSGGTDYLCSWLCAEEPSFDDIIKRQDAVKALLPLFRLRDKLAFFARCGSENKFDGKRLIGQIDKIGKNKTPDLQLITLFTLAGINIILFGAYYFLSYPPFFFITLTLYLAVSFYNAKYIKDLLKDASEMSDEFKKIGKILVLIETFGFKSKPLKDLCKPVTAFSPHQALRKMNILLTAAGLRANPIVQITINLIFPADHLLNLFLGRHSAELTKRLPQWLDVWYQLDGLSALADFAWLHSNYSFPRITEHHKEDRNILSAVQIGHPLIDEEIRVKNDFRIDKDRGIALITGSNMSGKSTFLRTIGINIVLAYAGAPVCASQFSLKLLKLLTCINISDSLGEGISYFYAEVKRLKLIIEQQKTVFFLIDEIYRGTNNRERLIGSRAIIKRLAEKKNFGIISTHDLELTAMEKEILFLRNFHFRDTISNGKMIFDYKLHDGPCPTTNALKIMEAEGLPI